MSSLARILSPLPAVVFACIAFAFTVVTITSPDWSRQYHYNTSEAINWTNPIYTSFRSPFKICELDENTNQANKVKCTVYGIHSKKTSCETLFVTKSDDNHQTGDVRLCQQIHIAGNLAITATTMITLGFVLTLVTAVIGYTQFAPSANQDDPSPLNTDTAIEEDDDKNNLPGAGQTTYGRTTSTTTGGIQGAAYPSFLNLALITSFSIGAISTFISQFYGVLAFTESAPDNSVFSGTRGTPFDVQSDNQHAPWIQGKALNSYATCAWVFSAFAAGAAAAVWRLPKWQKYP